MKALRSVGRALLIALRLATVTLGGGLLMVPLTLRPFTPPRSRVLDHSG
jgi:hypothetical protein